MSFDGTATNEAVEVRGKYPRIKTAIWDCEGDGLLHQMTRIHCLVIRDFERKITYRFRRNDVEDTIDDGIDLLEDAELTVGINNLYFDNRALSVAYDGVNLRGKVRDALVMSRMCFADQKEKDFRLFEQGKLPGKLIGSHSLKAWGHRLGCMKGDYAEIMEERAKGLGIVEDDAVRKFVWGAWNQEMDDYCVQDVVVTTLLWQKILNARWSEEATVLEHCIHDLMGTQADNGIDFNVPEALKLAEELENEVQRLETTAIKHYGKWWAPAKKHIVKALWDDPDGLNAAKKYKKPRPEFEEDDSRKVWGDVVVVKKTLNYKDPERASRTEGATFCPVVCKEFNPGSRDQIIDRFTTVYKWHPVDFTETGRPEVSDDVLRKLGDSIPMALELAEIFYYRKRLGQLKTGPGAWLKKVKSDGRIHAYVNVGGTISGRASHVDPNLAQVPKVKVGKVNGKTVILKGREGDHGFECRNLFYAPEGWEMTGVDLSGIELRCFGEKLARYDGGAYLDLILSGDIHTHNQTLAGLPTRDMAKTFIYACVPMDTTALTRRGWVGYDELEVGEDVLTYNAVTKVKEWKPVLEKVRYEDAEVVELKHKHGFSVRSTPNHRWFTTRRSGRHTRFWVDEVVTTDELTSEHNIIVNAPMREDSLKNPMIVGRQTVRNYVTCQKIQRTVLERQPVWCIRTANESWVMRQGNTITITGNTLYGAGDIKVGSIVSPLADEDEQRSIGEQLRARFMTNLPSYALLVREIKRQAKRGYLDGLDGRRLYVRSPHSALNTLLQSDGALISKKWLCLTEDYIIDAGLRQGWDKDFVNLLWIHDEQQLASRGHGGLIADCAIRAARDAGKHFGYSCPIDAEAKHGYTWAQTH